MKIPGTNQRQWRWCEKRFQGHSSEILVYVDSIKCVLFDIFHSSYYGYRRNRKLEVKAITISPKQLQNYHFNACYYFTILIKNLCILQATKTMTDFQLYQIKRQVVTCSSFVRSPGTLLDNKNFQIAASFLLGASLCLDQRYPCENEIDFFGLYSVCITSFQGGFSANILD